MKRWLSLLMLTATVLMVVQVGASGVNAAPAAVASNLANAKLFPPDTALYVDLHTSDLANTVKSALALVENLTGNKQDKAFAQINQGLTMLLGHPATVEKDVFPWIGDHVSIGLRIPDNVMSMTAAELEKNRELLALSKPQIIVVIEIKDKAAADAFWDAALKTIEKPFKIETSTVEIDGTKFSVATGEAPSSAISAAPQKVSLARGDKYVALGDADSISLMLDNLKNKKPSLGDDAKFTKVTTPLKDDALGLTFVAPRLYYLGLISFIAVRSQIPAIQSSLVGTTTPQPQKTPTAAAPSLDDQLAQLRTIISTIEGQAFSVRLDGKTWILDSVASVDLEAAKKLFGASVNIGTLLAPKLISGKLASQVPSDALIFATSSGLNNVYDAIKAAMALNMPGANAAQLEQGKKQFAQLEAALTLYFDLNLRDDVLAWMDGEFAVYATYNPNSTLTKASGSNKAPFDVTVLIQTTQPDKAKNFLTKLNAGITKLSQGKVTAKSLGDDLYSVATPEGVEIDYGLIDKTFIITTSTGLDKARAALKGDGVLSASTIWKNAQATVLDQTNEILFVNIGGLVTAAQAMMPSTASENDKRVFAILQLLESAEVTSNMPQPGLTVSRLQVTLK